MTRRSVQGCSVLVGLLLAAVAAVAVGLLRVRWGRRPEPSAQAQLA
jgi:hypothetical protein